MKNKLHRIIVPAVCICMAAGVHLAQEFRFYNIESNDLFLYDWTDIWTRIRMTGGLSTLLASFLTQFMRIPFAGTVIVTGLYMLVAYLVYKVLSRIHESAITGGFAFLPVAFLFLCMENDYYRFQGHVAFVLMISALFGYICISRDKLRYLAGILIVPVLYHAAGSVTMVFAVSAMLFEIIKSGLRGLVSLVYPAVFAAVAAVYVKCSLVSSWEHAMTPYMYYDWPSTYFFPIYAWSVLPALIPAVYIVSSMNLNASFVRLIAVVGLVLSFVIAGNLYSQVHTRSFYRLLQEQYWAENEEWDKIISTADRRQPNFLISYLNLALANKGQLVQNFRYYNQQDLSSLMFPTQNLKTGLYLQSTVYQAWGYLGSARKAAFDGNVVTPGSRHPRQLQSLVRLNMVLGAYDVAEKYINLLEKTLFYRGWACEMRGYLDNQEAIKQDKVMGMMYASIPLTDEYARYEGVAGDMRDIFQVCPSNAVLAQFYELYKILEDAK